MTNNENGIIMFNKNQKCVVRALVSLYTIRKFYDGPITFFIETSPDGFDTSVKEFGCDVIYNDDNKDLKTLVRKTSLFVDSPYEKTLWLDSDTALVGKIDEMFDYLENYEVVIPNFADWHSDGRIIKRRIMNFKGHVSDEILNTALDHKPAVNTGVVAYRKNTTFMKDWIELAIKTNGLCFISDEIAFQVLYPSYKGIYIAPQKFNVSARFGDAVEDKRIIHFHGQKHVLPFPLCDIWKNAFKEMQDGNIANINHFVEEHADRRLRKYLRGERVWGKEEVDEDIEKDGNTPWEDKDTTIVTACDEKYVEVLKETFPNWRKYKNIDEYPVIVFVHGIPIDDSRLDFLKLPNVEIIPWSMDNVETHREEMLSAFVFGTAENVKTDYWLKLDADSYASDNRPFIDDSMKEFAFCGHKWGYSRPDHIKKLDEWAKGHWKKKLNSAKPMIEDGKIEGNRFYHSTKRTISYIQFHKTKFTKFCVSLLKDRRLPAPTQDTFMFYVQNRFDPELVGVKNFKKSYGFQQGKGKWGSEGMRKKLQEIEDANKNKTPIIVVDREEDSEENDNPDIHVEMERMEIPVTNPETKSETSIAIDSKAFKLAIDPFENKPYMIPEGKDVIIEIREI